MQRIKDNQAEDLKKVYELDFGDQNLFSQDVDTICSEIRSQIEDAKGNDELEYRINVRWMTQEDIDALPEWGN